MADKMIVDAALEKYFVTLNSQISAGDQLKNAVNDVLATKEKSEFQKPGNAKTDEWDVLDQSYISIKLQNAFSEIESRAVNLQGNVTKLRKGEHERNVSRLESSADEVLTLVLSLIKELHEYHKAVADCLAPLVEYSVYRERYPTKYEMKECCGVPVTWKAVNEVNRSLRYGYGLSKEDVASILAWKHGEDLSESARKNLNQRVDILVQTYKERLGNLDTCEVDVPIAFQLYPLVLQDVLKDCCSPVESIAAVGQIIPDKKEDLDTLILREIPKIQLKIGDVLHEVASPGKAFENTKQKMHAVRHLVSKAFKSQKAQINKEQLDLFSLKVLATACISVANASSRTAVLMAFGKANLIQVRPFSSKTEGQPAQITLDCGCILIEVPSQWSLVEDSDLLSSLVRDFNSTLPIATVDTIYRGSFDVKAELERRAQSLPVVRIQKCSGMVKNVDKKEPTSRGIRKRLSRATHKLFNRRSTSGIPQKASKIEGSVDGTAASSGIVNLAANVQDGNKDDDRTLDISAETNTPVPPPRPRRKARKKRKTENARKQRDLEEAKHDPKWFSSCRKLQAPDKTDNKDQSNNSVSVASFEELRDVIDFLSGSSTSSLCLSQQLDADKSNLKKTLTSKEAQSTFVIDDKGKVSPSDSGIGSTMSMRSHPSVGSISGLSRHEKLTRIPPKKSKIGLLDDKGRIILNKDGKLEIESSGSDEKEDENQTILLNDELDFETNEDCFGEDAEVERYIRKTSSCLQLVEDEKSKIEATKGRIANEDPCKTPTATRTSSTSSENDRETSVQDVIDDLKALGLQRKDLDITSCHNDDEMGQKRPDDRKTENLYEERTHFEAENESELAVVSDNHSYDADGSEESEENNPQPDAQSRSLSSNTFHGSTESLYYSAWALNELNTEVEANSIEQTHTNDETDSFFSDGLKESNLSENLDDPEDFQDCRQPPEMLYQHFNTRFSWPDGFGDQFAAIWHGESESDALVTSIPSGVWSTGTSLTNERHHSIQDGAQYRQLNAPVPFQTSQAKSPLAWAKRAKEESFNAQSNEENWKGVAAPSLRRQHEDLFSSDWPQRVAKHAGPERSSPLHSSLKRVGLANAPHMTSQTASWNSTMDSRLRALGPRGQTLGRPSSVPAQISRQFPPQSKPLCNQAGFDFDGVGAARHAQSPPFRTAASSTPGGHAQYQNWSRETGSEPILGSSNARQMSEIEAMTLQQNQARNQLVNRILQKGQNTQKWS